MTGGSTGSKPVFDLYHEARVLSRWCLDTNTTSTTSTHRQKTCRQAILSSRRCNPSFPSRCCPSYALPPGSVSRPQFFHCVQLSMSMPSLGIFGWQTRA
eukprot:669194-Rhodomonas_salina.3